MNPAPNTRPPPNRRPRPQRQYRTSGYADARSFMFATAAVVTVADPKGSICDVTIKEAIQSTVKPATIDVSTTTITVKPPPTPLTSRCHGTCQSNRFSTLVSPNPTREPYPDSMCLGLRAAMNVLLSTIQSTDVAGRKATEILPLLQ
ncbi:hypothetical protein BJ508DRAFT_315183 [Ascobolus immersus RN42]|uniref:Uncharacterized protein n=1 Tax=Ascobolus immersus RN42 TaxID=1160509 RepID=A0A3N4HQH5_ASCIM|nr:hypothetical protein BJ508DRAFT_315183 [Ascobolus immersus RN42]